MNCTDCNSITSQPHFCHNEPFCNSCYQDFNSCYECQSPACDQCLSCGPYPFNDDNVLYCWGCREKLEDQVAKLKI